MRSKHHSHSKKRDYLKSAAATLGIIVLVLTTSIISFYCGATAADKQPIITPATEAVSNAAAEAANPAGDSKSGGETGSEVYAVEIWDDGSARVSTNQGYINQLSNHTVLITDRPLADVQQEILDVIDLPGVK